MKNNRFNIDFFEFSFLVEVCIPPVPIARSVFWEKVINDSFHVLTPDERKRLFTWITENSKFSEELKNENKDCKLFYDRYNPDNQYLIHTTTNEKYNCFLHNGRYHTNTTTSIYEESITKIEKI